MVFKMLFEDVIFGNFKCWVDKTKSYEKMTKRIDVRA